MKTVGIFCGGFSSEFEISIKSAQTIQDHFPPGYAVVKIIVSKQGWEVETRPKEGKSVLWLGLGS